MSACIFCEIARGERQAQLVYEDDLVVAFLDVGPIRPGHTQIISRAHVTTFEHLPLETGARMFALGQRLAKAMKDMYGVSRVSFLFSGGDIDHAHAHIVPMVERRTSPLAAISQSKR